MKKTLIIVGVIVAVIVLFVGIFASTNNKVVNFEEQILESISSLESQYKRRYDLFYNLVDAIISSNEFESGTHIQVVEARTNADNGDLESADKNIKFVVENYPELQGQKNYETYMLEVSKTENLIQQYRENLNMQVKNYKKYVRSFPASMILNIMGYEMIDEADYLKFDEATAPADAPKDLFNKNK